MTEDELELRILQRYVEQHRKAGPDDSPDVKRAQELDMREVLRELTGKTGNDLDYDAKMWFTRLVRKPSPGLPITPLRPGKSDQPYRARAFVVGGSAPAWERTKELEHLVRSAHAASSPPASQVNININGSTVAALNLGTVLGNMQAAITTLHQGAPEVARALQKLVEAVGADESLADQRREIIESLSQVGEEATKPEGQRKTGLVKTLLIGIGVTLSQSANIAQIWQTFGSPIKAFFGLP